MTLIVEDGTNVVGSQTYVSETTLTAYAAARGYTLLGDPTQLLLQAMDWLEAQQFIGIKSYYLQSLQWPRLQVVIDLYWQKNNTIPQLLMDCECEIAMAIDQGESPFASLQPKILNIKAGSVSVSYVADGTSNPINQKIILKLNKLIVGGGGFSTVRA